MLSRIHLTYLLLGFTLLMGVPSGYAKTDSLLVKDNLTYKTAIYTSAYYISSLFILGNTWYKDVEDASFHFTNDNSGYLQVDKYGHAFGAYCYSYMGYYYLLNRGYSRRNATYYGATLGAILQIPIEIMDGLHEDYGYSWGDIAANTLGSALVFGQAMIYDEQIVKYKFSYHESPYSHTSNGYLGESFCDRLLEDYNGHTYWLSLPLNRISGINKLPPWLNLAIGYGANGMYGEYENLPSFNGIEIPEATRYRQYLLSLDVDWAKFETDSQFLSTILKGMTFIKLPFPAIEFNSKGEIIGYWLYY